MILDLQNYLSNPASGDTIVANGADMASGQIVDQSVFKGVANFAQGGAEIAPFVFVLMNTSLVGGTSVAFVLQDSADGITFADVVVGPAILTASATAGKILFQSRLNRSMRRYLRGVYRTVGNVTGGIAIAVITLDVDNIDLSMRKADPVTVAEPTNPLDESVAQGILGQ